MYLWSDIKNCAVADVPYHTGIEYEGIVYCNIHPEGLEKNIWIEDFNYPGEKRIDEIIF